MIIGGGFAGCLAAHMLRLKGYDNITLIESDSNFASWNILFTPNNFLLEPGQTQNVLMTATIPESYDDGSTMRTITIHYVARKVMPTMVHQLDSLIVQIHKDSRKQLLT